MGAQWGHEVSMRALTSNHDGETTMKSSLVRSIGLFFGFVISVVADASYVNGGTVNLVIPLEGPGFIFKVSGNLAGNVPACATSTSATNIRYAIDPTTDAGKAMIAGVYLAKAIGNKIDVNGRYDYPTSFTNFCNVWGDTETVNNMALY